MDLNTPFFPNNKIFNCCNLFHESIIDNLNLLNVIFLLLLTLYDKTRLESYLSINEKNEIKNKELLLELSEEKFLKKNKNVDELINEKKPSFSIEYYQFILKYLEKITKKKQYIPDILEFCIINSLSYFFYVESGHTINIYLYDNFNKIKRGKTFDTLLKSTFISEVLNPLFSDFIKENKENTFNEEKCEFIDDKDKKQIIPINTKYIQLFNGLGKKNNVNEIIKNFFNNFNDNIMNLFKVINEQSPIANKISPLIYLGIQIKFNKLKYIYEQHQSEMTEDFIKYLFNQIRILYYNPKSAFKYIYYILFTVFEIRNSTQISLKNVPYKYDISQAFLEFDASFIMASAMKYDTRIKSIIFNQNRFGEIGLYETAKNLLFNQNITTVNIGQMNITAQHLKFFNLGLTENHSVIDFNLNNNIKITESSGKEIANILTKFPKLSILNLNKCKIGSGLKYILESIKNQFNITKLYLSKTSMDQVSIKVLCEIVQNYKCKIKILSINNCNFNNKMGRKFLQIMCRNKSIEELYMYNCNLNDSFFNEISQLIISGNLNVVSFYKNNITNFETILKIISLTTFNSFKAKNLDEKKENMLDNQLTNLDLSVNPIEKETIDQRHIDIFENICENINLDILDVSQTINGENPKLPKENESIKNENNDEDVEMKDDNDVNIYEYRIKKLNNHLERVYKYNNIDIYF